MLTDTGLFLSFDGVPRSGRTTQADALAALLTEILVARRRMETTSSTALTSWAAICSGMTV
jgi:thymidylate kinase